MGFENISYDNSNYKNTPNEANVLNSAEQIETAELDRRRELLQEILSMNGLPLNQEKNEDETILQTYTDNEGETMYVIGGRFGNVSEAKLTEFLTWYPNIKLTNIGLADMLKSNTQHYIGGTPISELFSNFLGLEK